MSKYNELIGNMTSKFDVLKWWEDHNTEFPLMWNLAEVYLAIPATSAASERAFSIAGNIVTARRSRLNPKVVEDIHLLHDNAWLLRELKGHFYLTSVSLDQLYDTFMDDYDE